MKIFDVILLSVPIFSSLTCGAIFFVSYQDKLTPVENTIKRLLVCYFLLMIFLWFKFEIYAPLQQTLRYIIPLYCLVLQTINVIFYNFIYALTPLGKRKTIPLFHYLIPCVLFVIVSVITFIYYISDPESFAPRKDAFIFLRPYIVISTIAYIGIYIVLCIKRVYQYRQSIILQYGKEKWESMRWLSFVIGLRVLFFVVFIIDLVFQVKNFALLISFISTPLQHILIVYNIIQRNYLLYTPKQTQTILVTSGNVLQIKKKKRKRDISEKEAMALGERLIVQSEFEKYFKENKPYLDPQFKITDLIFPFHVNRTYLSTFINKTYGMNFSNYVNNWRLMEVKRLARLPQNKDRDIAELVAEAGFGSFRNYLRVKKAEDSDNNPVNDQY